MILGRITNDCPRRTGFSSRAGVSLVTVLLFMLVATIAATATYKWLTSEGRSSASRMQQQEAYQSAVAGIESARSWMMYNANETGAIIKQYKDGKNVPVKLTDRLAAFVRAGQHYDVYLVGVNTENKTYKLKILSEGTSRNGSSTHSEIAILSVNGLYQVQVPVAESHSSIKFDFNYFGGSTQAQGHVGAKSMLINGNLTGSNPVYAQTDLIVTGNIEMSGNSVGADGTVCVGGNLEASNGVFGNSFYIEGDARHFAWPSASEAKNTFLGLTTEKYSVTGDVYINGHLEAPTTGGQLFPKNLTLNGTWTTNFPGYASSVTGDLCLGDTGFVYINKFEGKTFGVGGNVWMPGNATMPGHISFWKGDISGSNCVCNRFVKTCTKKNNWGWCTEYGWDLEETGVACTGNSSTANHKNVVQNCEGSLTMTTGDDGNWGEYEKLFLGQQAESQVYIRNAYTLTDYNNLRENTKGVTTTAHVQYCNGDNCSQPHYWKNETIYPYPEKSASPGKPNPNYIYYMPTDTWDVAYGSYYDDFWKKTIHTFFIDFPTGGKNSTTVFTTSYHSQETGMNAKEGNDWYRYLNRNGAKVTGSPWCKKKPGTTSFTPECGVAPWFGSLGTVTNVFPTEKPFPCADTVKTYCLAKLGERKTGCDGASYKVDDLLKTAYDTFEQYANRGCRDVTTWSSDMSSKLNACYAANNTADKAKDSLYNGYQVVKVTDNGKADPNTELNGKFIIIVTNTMGQQSLPPTTEGSYVFLYLPEGGRSTVQPADEGKGHKYNYFIFTEQSVTSGGNGDAGFMFNNDVLSGSIYAKAANCANVQNFKARKLEYNQELMDDLQNAAILCEYSAATCGGTATSSSSAGSSESSAEYASGGYDKFYVSVAPQLSVTLESQYKNTESVSSANASEVGGSFIVLPRIIYLPKDAKGKLENYYNIVPLNTASSVTSPTVSCSGGLPVTGKLVPGETKLTEGDYTCKVVATVQSRGTPVQQTVPFWVRVKGEGGTLPVVSFGDPTKELDIESSTPVTLSLPSTSGSTQTCRVTVTVSGDINDWTVVPATGVESAGANTYTMTVSSDATLTAFTVTNSASENGSIYLTITDTDGCAPGGPEVLFNASTAPIERKSLSEYCTDYPGDADCASGGAYYVVKNRPDCGESGEWVTVDGTACSISETNERWRCAVSGGVSLKKVKDVPGCEVVIPPMSHNPPLTVNKEPPYYLYASLKKVPLTFHTGFSTEGNIDGSRKVKIAVDGVDTKECTYSDFTNDELRSEKCDVVLYYGSVVNLSLEPANPSDFNYWVCESGLDCPDGDAHAELTYQITVTSDDDYVYAHFGEDDKHCFFDEFKEPTRGSGYRHNRDNIWCGGETNYCIDYCENDGNTCESNLTTSSYPNAKWRLMAISTATKDDLDYSVTDARIALKSSATRGKKESEKRAAFVMSSVQAGVYGTLKAQFQLPHQNVGSGDVSAATTYYSGFVLRSNPSVSSFLLLNIFAASDGAAHARLCLNGSLPCKDLVLQRNSVPYTPTERNPVVLMSAALGPDGDHDTLKVKLYPSAWTTEPYVATFTLTESELSGVTALASRPNEYVGYALSDQNFKIYGIGWKSESYRSECWDTYPVLSCSFKAAYPSGIVPKGRSVKPWVGFSAWFDAVANGCGEGDVGYWYKGDDACSSTGTEYINCGGSYSFSGAGAHGYKDGGEEVRMAVASVATSCNAYGEEVAWARNDVAANCGSFWVGEMNACSRNHTFDNTASGMEGDYFGLVSGTANLRDATLKINLDNPDGKNVEVYLFSQNNSDGYTYGNSHLYSLPYQSNSTGTGVVLNIPVNSLLNSEGFDPENVLGVYVKTFGESSVIVNSVMSSCPNATEINTCSATYDGTSWRISANIKNSANTKKIDVVEGHSYITDPTSLECEKETSDEGKRCTFSGDNAVFSWSDNPYAYHAGDTYSFEITLTSNDDVTSECTAKGSVTGISADCGGASAVSATSVVQGRTLPQFTYSISNCPDDACSFKIDLTKDGSTVKTITTQTTSGNVSGAQTASVAATKPNGDPLDVGTYKFALISTNAARPFVGCNSVEFEVTAPGAITAHCEFAGTVVKGGSATLQMTNIQNVDGTTAIAVARSGADPISASLTSNADKSISITAPGAANSYEYTVSYVDPISNTTKNICTATLTVVDGLGCSVSPSAITLGQSFTFTPTWGGNCTSTTLTGNGVSSPTSCATSYEITPDATGDQTYTYKFTGDIGTNVECPTTPTVTVNPPAPTFDCSASSTAYGTPASMNLTNIHWCDDNCAVVLKKGNTTLSGNNESTNGNNNYTVTFTDEVTSASTVDYTVTLTSDKTSDAKTCSVVYTSGGSATCVMQYNSTNLTRFTPGRDNVYFKASNFSDILTSSQSSSLKCSLNGVEKISKTTTCNPGNGTNGSCDQISLTIPSDEGQYDCSLDAGTTNLCKFTFDVNSPITCSVTPSSINGTTNVTFSALIDTALNRIYSLNLHDCGFKKDGNWKDNDQNPHGSADGNADSWTQSVSTSTTFTYECKQGSGEKTCSKNVILQAPPSITNCAALTSTKKTGDPVSIRPAVENCENNCEWHISGYENLDHSIRDWSSGGTIGLSTVNSDGEKSYKLTVENDYGDDDCDFKITYSSGVVCHAPTGCSTPVTSGSFDWDGQCYFATTFSWTNNNSSGNYSINGVTFNGYVNQYTNNFPATIDGGYYIKTNISGCCGADISIGEPTCN